MSPSSFAELLRHFRSRAGLSQSDLAERARLSESAIGSLERGRRRAPYRHTIEVIADALELDDDERTQLLVARRAHRERPTVDTGRHNIPAPRTTLIVEPLVAAIRN